MYQLHNQERREIMVNLTPIQGEMLTPMPKIQSKPQTMDFPDAIKQIINGKKVARVSWGNTDFILMKDAWLSIYTKGAFHTLLVSDGDMVDTNDWVIVKEIN